jgi:ankyrin repeat protein
MQGSPLLCAAVTGRCDIAQLLLDNGANINAVIYNLSNSLIIAARHGHTNFVKLLLANNVNDINAQNAIGLTALISACIEGYVEVARVLIDHHADINLPCSQGISPLIASCMSKSVESVKLLLQQPNCDVLASSLHQITAWTANFKFSEDKTVPKIEIAKLLLATGKIDVNERTPIDETALLVASQDSDLDFINYLIDIDNIDIDLGAENDKGVTCTPIVVAMINYKNSVTCTEKKRNHDIINKLLGKKVKDKGNTQS